MLKRTPTVLVAIALAAAACSSGSATATTVADTATDPSTTVTSTTAAAVDTTTTSVPASDGFPVTIVADNGEVTIDQMPSRIVSLSPTATEILFAIGAGDQVVAVDSLSNHPADAPVTDLTSWTPSVEAIAAFNPDVVFISFDPGDVVAGLAAIGIPTVLHGTAFTLDAAFAQWEQTGAATGHLAESVQLVAETQADIDAAVSSVGGAGTGLTYYYEIDNLLYSTTSASFIGQLLAPLGLVNVADEAPDPDGYGYPQLSSEYLVDADPALILLADTKCCAESAESVAQRPGWDTMTAIDKGSVVELDDDVASRWGPRIVELVEAVADAITSLVAINS